jgi:hypothetical protein
MILTLLDANVDLDGLMMMGKDIFGVFAFSIIALAGHLPDGRRAGRKADRSFAANQRWINGNAHTFIKVYELYSIKRHSRQSDC